MKKIIYTVCAIVIAQCSIAQSFTPIDAGSSVKFLIKNFGSNVTGSFTGLKGFILYNPAKITSTIFNVTVDANTVNTGNGSRDKHLKKEDYFNVAAFNTINFLSSKVSTTDVAGVFKVDGYVTIKGIKKVVSFPFRVTPSGTGFIFTGEFTINRRDFTVGSGSLVLADNLVVKLQVNSTKN